ncbi:MAG: alternative ribosome rescue aminoacyl-tRNA hydrolase ArfB [candidate division SR1 bacterium]|nr:alternative ribosome rescue aminoacyl-tRNA hydrolase ArfB [candidate division SR1 bacterium]
MDIENIIENILAREVHFHFSKSGGPGGQNVNKRETKAELYFNIHDSQQLTSEQKQRLIDIAGHMVHHEEGILIMTCREERYQNANKEKVIHHFKQLLEETLTQPKERIATNIPNAEREARIMDKKFISKTKQLRQKLKGEE